MSLQFIIAMWLHSPFVTRIKQRKRKNPREDPRGTPGMFSADKDTDEDNSGTETLTQSGSAHVRSNLHTNTEKSF